MNKDERKFLYRIVKQVPVDGIIVEIGSFLGDSSSQMFAKGIKKYQPSARLYCIDSFDDSFFEGQEEFYKKVKSKIGNRRIIEVFKENMKAFDYQLIKMDSSDAAKEFTDESVDLVFIDADHSYEAVSKDIDHWWPKLKPGGIMCGHDYMKKQFGVTEAVKEQFSGQVNNPVSSIWEVRNDGKEN